jgi:hypothetical protein
MVAAERFNMENSASDMKAMQPHDKNIHKNKKTTNIFLNQIIGLLIYTSRLTISANSNYSGQHKTFKNDDLVKIYASSQKN